MKAIINYIIALGMAAPWPYRVNHCIIASLIMAVIGWPSHSALAGAVGGSMFYVGREFQQYDAEGQTGLTTLGDFGVPLLWVTFVAFVIDKVWQ